MSTSTSIKRARRKLPKWVVGLLGTIVLCSTTCGSFYYYTWERPQYIVLDVAPPQGKILCHSEGACDNQEWDETETTIHVGRGWRAFVWRRVTHINCCNNGDTNQQAILEYFDTVLAQQGWERIENQDNLCLFTPEYRFLERNVGYWAYRQHQDDEYYYFHRSAIPTVCVAIWPFDSPVGAGFHVVLSTVNPPILTVMLEGMD